MDTATTISLVVWLRNMSQLDESTTKRVPGHMVQGVITCSFSIKESEDTLSRYRTSINSRAIENQDTCNSPSTNA